MDNVVRAIHFIKWRSISIYRYPAAEEAEEMRNKWEKNVNKQEIRLKLMTLSLLVLDFDLNFVCTRIPNWNAISNSEN